MKKTIIVTLAVLGIIVLFLGYRIYYVVNFFSQVGALSSNLDYDGRGSVKANDDNFPADLIQLCADSEIQGKMSKVDKYLLERDSKYFNREAANQLVLTAEPEFSQSLDKFKDIASIVKRRMKETKSSIPATFKESENFPANPSFKTMRATARYWTVISRMLEQKKDYENSLLLSHAILYISRDLQAKYITSGSLINKMISVAINNIACYSIMYWASRPKPQCKELSKEVAKDILDFVKNDYPISNSMEHESLLLEDIFNSFAKKGSSMFAKLLKSRAYKEMVDKGYKNPMKFFDKPLYEIKKELSDYSEEYNKLVCYDTSTLVFYVLFNPEKAVSVVFFSMSCPNFKKAKESCESSLAQMEMTAIGLAINSFVCEKKKYPKSMDELSEWFGSKLPNNRITNEPYELDFEGNHVIYNNSVDGKEIYFDFSVK